MKKLYINLVWEKKGRRSPEFRLAPGEENSPASHTYIIYVKLALNERFNEIHNKKQKIHKLNTHEHKKSLRLCRKQELQNLYANTG